MIRAILACAVFFCVYGEEHFDPEPVFVITGEQTELNRPEGAAFSPDGSQLAIANSEGACVTIYHRVDETSFSSAPDEKIWSEGTLWYAHDLEYTPDGKHLAIACRESQTVVLLPLISGESPTLIQGAECGLYDPADVAFSPDGETMGVCSRLKGISYYRKEDGAFAQTPYATLDEEQFLEVGMSCPHALSFCPNRNEIAFTCKPYPKFREARGLSGLAIYTLNESFPLYLYPTGNRCLHSICYHPSGDLIAATDERFGLLLFERVEGSREFKLAQQIPFDKKGGLEGPKGIAFSPDGKLLAVTTVLNEVMIFHQL